MSTEFADARPGECFQPFPAVRSGGLGQMLCGVLHELSRPESTHLDELDARLIGLLEENPRGSNSSFAREPGVSEKTIRVRMERLFSEFDMRIEVSVRDRP